MRKLTGAVAVAAVLAGAPTVVQAQAAAAARPFNLGAQLSLETEGSSFGIGVRYENALNTLLPSMPSLRAAASFDYFFPDVGSLWELNVNVLYGFSAMGPGLTPYAGAGLGIAGNGGTDVGLNLVGGTRLRAMGSITPYIEARFELRDQTNFVITAGAIVF